MFRVQIRDYEKWKSQISQGYIEIPEECQNNALILSWILDEYASRVVKNIKNLEEQEVETIAKSVAYMVRTDMLKSDILGILSPPIYVRPSKDELPGRIEFLNDPEVLNEKWKPFWTGNSGKKEDNYAARASELFRCYWGTLGEMPNLEGRLYPKLESFGCAASLADVTAYLLSPTSMTNYRYTSNEIDEFNETIIRQMSEI